MSPFALMSAARSASSSSVILGKRSATGCAGHLSASTAVLTGPSEGGDAEVPQRDPEFLKRPSPAVISRSDFDGRFPPQLGTPGGAGPAPKRHQGDVELAGNLGSGTSSSGASSGRSGVVGPSYFPAQK